MTRIEIPIPQQQDLAFEFVAGKNGLLEFHGESIEAHVAAFRFVDKGVDDHYWSEAAIAASLSKKYGKGEYGDEKMKAFGEAVDRSVGYLRQIARTYRTFTVNQNVSRDNDLSFNIHRIACLHPSPVDALAQAKAHGMTCRALEVWISEQSLRRASKATRKAHGAARSSWRDHLLHMDKVIVEDFIQNSPNKEFARRVCADWRQEIADELKQLEISENRELVIDAIDNRGAEDLKAIQRSTGIKKEHVGWLVGRLVAENLYEWIPKGGKGDEQRGSPSMILHKVGERDGGAYNVTRTENQYAH